MIEPRTMVKGLRTQVLFFTSYVGEGKGLEEEWVDPEVQKVVHLVSKKKKKKRFCSYNYGTLFED